MKYVQLTILAITCTMAWAQNPRRIPKIPTVKVYKTERFEFHASGIPGSKIMQLADAADAFVLQFENDWNVRLGDELIPVAIGVDVNHLSFQKIYDAPSWLASGYVPQLRRIVIQIGDYQFDPQPVIQQLRREIVRYLIRSHADNVPAALETGMLLRLTSSFSSRDGYRAVFAFRAFKDLSQNPKFIGDQVDADNPKFQVLSFLMVDWLMSQRREQVQVFLHHLLRGTQASDALVLSNMGQFSELVGKFEENQRPLFGLKRLFWTTDALLTLIGLILLTLAGMHIRQSMQFSRSGEPLSIEPPAQVDRELEEALRRMQQAPPRRRRPTTAAAPASAPASVIDKDLDSFFAPHIEPESVSDPQTSFAAADEVVFVEDGIEKSLAPKPTTPKPTPARKTPRPEETSKDDTLDIELDQFFGQVTKKEDDKPH